MGGGKAADPGNVYEEAERFNREKTMRKKLYEHKIKIFKIKDLKTIFRIFVTQEV